jgi:paraquat-inducible protein B
MTIVVANPDMQGANPIEQEAACQLLVTAGDYEKLLEEKTEVIRELHLQIQELKTRIEELEGGPPISHGEAAELIALTEELEEGQRQLKADQEMLTGQMREMEIQMSRERAEFARQRSELQRLQQQIHHELEVASREAELRDRLKPFLRHHQSLTHRAADAGTTAVPSVTNGRANTNTPLPKERGLLRWVFGAREQ